MRNLWRNREGSAALEFGLVATPFVILIFGIIEFAIILFLNASLEAGVINASRYAVTGSTTPGITREEKVVEVLNRYGFGLVDIQQSNLLTLIYPNFASIGQPEPFVDANANTVYDPGETFTDVNGNAQWDADMGLAGLGGAGDIVVYTVDYTWGLLTGMMHPFIGDMTLTSSVAVRNEPYGNSGIN